MARMRLTNAGKVGRPKSMFTNPGDFRELGQTTESMRAKSLQELMDNNNDNNNNNNNDDNNNNNNDSNEKQHTKRRSGGTLRRSNTFGSADVRPTPTMQQKTEDDCVVNLISLYHNLLINTSIIVK